MSAQTEHDFRSSTSGDDIESHDEEHIGHADGAAPLEKQSTAASGLSVFEQRAHSVVSRIRSRDPGQTARFTHPLSHTQTNSDVIVDFDGPDDPYRPLNWGFTKKAVTTALYGLTTMGMCVLQSYSKRVRRRRGDTNRCFRLQVLLGPVQCKTYHACA